VVAPATFNTVNKIANGISDTLAVGLVCEGLGAGIPTVIVPWQNRALGRFPAYARSIGYLQDVGARLLLTDCTRPDPDAEGPRGAPFPWPQVHHALDVVLHLVKAGG
jgi:phosphopantothenoylcysteine synthetase/decarboxylase